DRAAVASVVRRLSVPPGILLDAARGPYALHCVHPRGPRVPGPPGDASARREGGAGRESLKAHPGHAAVREARMKLCGHEVGLHRPLFLIAGPCVVESEQLQIDTAGRLKEICARLDVPFIFKSS